MFTPDQHKPADVEAALQSLPLYQVLKQQEPNTYRQIVNTISNGIQNHESPTDIVRQAGTLLEPLLLKRLPYTSDSALWQFISNLNRNLNELYQHTPQQCYYYLFPGAQSRPSNDDLLRISKIGQSIQPALEQVFLDYNPDRPLPGEAQVIDTIDDILTKLEQDYGDDIALFDASENVTDPEQQKTLCAMTIDLYQYLIDRHDTQAADTLRYLFAQ